MGLFSELLNIINESEKEKKNEQLEKEMDLYGLEEVEREFVRRGDYEPYNFEDDEEIKLDEDDYYFDN